MTWDELRAQVLGDPSIDQGRGVSEAKVRAAESLIGPLPLEFRQYLLDFGSLTKGHRRLYGLGPDVHPSMNVVRMTLLERADAPGLPQTAVVFYNNGSGDLSFVNPSGQVQTWLHETPADPYFEAPTFATWLSDHFGY
ncbi:SMI1/KNR4 family protein [Kribbella deserti]|uniref:SMI1/KNR4 family protein n=1 Tax=Kribbella deserti TaxID=1926257 RepID=A0ABV6QIC9_9ACTN